MKTDSLPEMIKAGCMTCATIVLLFLAFANTVYGQGVDANGNNLSVPVLAESMQNREPRSLTADSKHGEARESTKDTVSRVIQRDSRGAQNTLAIRHGKTESESFAALRGSDEFPKPSRQTLSNAQPTSAACPESAAELYARLCDQENSPWTEPTPIPIPLPKPSELLSMQLP